MVAQIMTPTDYGAFLTTKQRRAPATGFTVAREDLPAALFDYQRHVTAWALGRGRAALFLERGLGKTVCQLAWGQAVHQHVGRDILILAPLGVCAQTQDEARDKLGLEITIARSQRDVHPGITITNYENLANFDASHFGGVILDECFAPDTPIDTPSGPVAIKDIRIGDAIFNAAGIDRVADVHRREVKYAVRIIVNGKTITSSPNHPYFTQRGWVGAQDLIPGDRIMESSTAMRLVFRNLRSQVPVTKASTILRDILLSEMADEATRYSGESAFAGSGEEAWRQAESLASVGKSRSGSGEGTYSGAQSNSQRRGENEDLPPIERDEARTFRAWGQWSGIDRATADLAGCAWRRMGSGISFVTGSTDSGLSHALQTRHRQSQDENRYRSGWQLPSQQEGVGSEEGCEVGFAWVESLEVLEPGHPELEKLRNADGCIYLYDLGATRHPSFSINGLLVHNSSKLKNYSGVLKQTLIRTFAETPYRLCCTATPAPNDPMEIGNHAEFLGVMPSNEMIMRWFINDTMQSGHYRLKGHAEADFYAWIASWAIAIETPADLGYSDHGFILPPLNLHHEIVEVDRSIDRGDQLFRAPKLTATTSHREMRLTVASRAERAAALVNPSADAWVVWCQTNYEADALKSLIPDAIEVRGSETPKAKERKLAAFTHGEARAIITKPDIAGYGLNWQHTHKGIYMGSLFSFEDFYQCSGRQHRFRQSEPVDFHVILAETEMDMLAVLDRKIEQFTAMKRAMVAAVSAATVREDLSLTKYQPRIPMQIPAWLKERAA